MQSNSKRLLTLPNDESRNDGAADMQRIRGNHIPEAPFLGSVFKHFNKIKIENMKKKKTHHDHRAYEYANGKKENSLNKRAAGGG
jgi:hypothetical protein